MLVAATASGGDTMAPSAKATGQLMPGMTALATTATAAVVTTTSPTARRVIGRRLRRKSRSEVKYAADHRMGGRKIRNTISGSRGTTGSRGTKLSASPPSTRKIGSGIRMRRASAVQTRTATSNRTSVSRE